MTTRRFHVWNMHGPTVYAGPELFPLIGICKKISIAGGKYRIFDRLDGMDQPPVLVASFEFGALTSYNPSYGKDLTVLDKHLAEPHDRKKVMAQNQNPDPASEAARLIALSDKRRLDEHNAREDRYAPTGLGCGSGLIKDPDPELERLLDEEDEIDRKAAQEVEARAAQRRHRLRLLLAAEFTRCKTYDYAVIDAALDDADVAIDFLRSLGVLDLRAGP